MRIERTRWFFLLLLAACDKPAGSSSSAPVASATSAAATVLPAASASAALPAQAAPPETASALPDAIIAQHVLVAHKTAKRAPKGVTRSKNEARARAQEALGKIRAGAAFEDVVKEYSDDAGSIDRRGSLGKFRRGDMDPAFAAAAFALKPGEVSDVVETPFGFHVIKRTQ